MSPEAIQTPEEDPDTQEVDYDPETAPPGERVIDCDGRCTMCGSMAEDCECRLNEDFCDECGEFIADCKCLTCAKCKEPIAAGTQVSGPNGDLHEECFDSDDDGMDDSDED